MPKSELNLISQPASLASNLFEDSSSDSESPGKTGSQQPSDVFEKNELEKISVPGQISGRVPASNGAMGLVQEIDGHLGAGMRLAVFRGLKEIGLGFLESIYDNAGGEFDLPAGTALALKYEEKSYESGSRYVKEDEVRKACDEAFRRDGRDVIWVETQGVSEVGGGAGGTIPLGMLAEASANLKLKGLIKYRRFEPFESASGLLLKGQALANTVNVPVTATLARRMPPGAEFEFTGQFNLSLAPEITRPIGLESELGKIGASGKVGAKQSFKGETSVSVQRLPFGEEVMIKIAHGKSIESNIGAEFKAGMSLDKKAYEKMPELGKGALKYVLDRLGLPDAPLVVKRFLQSQIQVKSRRESRGTEIARFVFDLSKPSARKAYEAIFTRLSLGQTKALVDSNDSAVRSQRAGETALIYEKGAAALFGETKLLLSSALQTEREGKVSANGRSDVIYRDCKFEKTYVNWFHGEQKVKWETVTVLPSDKTPKQSYFHLAYTNSDRMTEVGEIEQFLNFAHGLGIKKDTEKKSGQVQPDNIAKILADRDDTETRADIYFTQEGISRIASSTKEEAVIAYMAADSEMSPKAGDPSFPILERFQEISNMWFFKRIFYLPERSRLRTAYSQAAPERDIDADSKLLQDARNFSEKISAIGSNDEKSTETFFMGLARASGFEFMRTIAALTKLATVNDTILHELSISGGGLTLAAIDEGEILHPERAMHRMLAKIA